MPRHGEPTPTARTRRLMKMQQLSRVMAMLSIVVAVALTGLSIFYWAATPWDRVLALLGMAPMGPPASETMLRIGGGAISLLPLAALILGLMAARSCFLALARGEVFSQASVRGLRGFAFWLLVSALLQPIAGAALSVLLSLGSGGPGQLAISFSSDILLALLFSGMVLVIATVMSEAIEIADDNAQIV
jgi:hypothetical protein